MTAKYIPTEGPDTVFDYLSTVFAKNSRWVCAVETGMAVSVDAIDEHGSRHIELDMPLQGDGAVIVGVYRYCGESRGVRYTVQAQAIQGSRIQQAVAQVFYDPGALDISSHVLQVAVDLRDKIATPMPSA